MSDMGTGQFHGQKPLGITKETEIISYAEQKEHDLGDF